MFQGFTPEATEFLCGILLNNNREWFMPHKEQYTRTVYQPMKELALEVQERLLLLQPQRQLNLKVTRIYRDVRIPRKDGPYKTSLWFTLRAPGGEWDGAPCLYFEIDAGGIGIGTDYFCSRPALMECYRQQLLRVPEAVEPLNALLKQRPEFVLNGPEYKRSKGEVGPALQPWFNRKRVDISRTIGPEDGMYSSELADRIVEDFLWLLPFYDFFADPAIRGEGSYTNATE